MKDMANRIALPLELSKLGAEDYTVEHKIYDEHLQRTVSEENQTRNTPGKLVRMRCYICRKYRKMMRYTCWMCKGWGMPLCKKDRSQEPSCKVSCLVKHRFSDRLWLLEPRENGV